MSIYFQSLCFSLSISITRFFFFHFRTSSESSSSLFFYQTLFDSTLQEMESNHSIYILTRFTRRNALKNSIPGFVLSQLSRTTAQVQQAQTTANQKQRRSRCSIRQRGSFQDDVGQIWHQTGVRRPARGREVWLVQLESLLISDKFV